MATATKSALLVDVFPQVEPHWKVDESADHTVVDGNIVLARVQGPFFLVNGTSLNKRFYSKSLWENAIAKVNHKLENGGLMGAIGHDQPINEKAVAEGKVSHVVRRLWIDENNVGMGEILVLNTDAGRQLNVLLRANVPIPVSSRAYGKISGKGPQNEDIVDPESFLLETFDFVINPGVKTAYPKVVENVDAEPVYEDRQMEIVERLTTEKVELQSKLAESLSQNIELREKFNKFDLLKSELDAFKESIGELHEAKAISEGLRKWLELEPFKTLAAKTNLLAQNGKSPSEVVRKLLHVTEEYASLGTPEELKAIKESHQKHEEIGTIAEMTRALDLLEAYVDLGAPAEVSKKLKATEKVAKKVLEAKEKAAAASIAKDFDVNEAATLDMVKSMGVEGTINALKKLKEVNGNKKRLKVDSKKKNESKPAGKKVIPMAGRSFSSRFVESLPEPEVTPAPAITR